MTRCLFVGGVADGEWREATEPHVSVLHRVSLPSVPFDTKAIPVTSATVKYDTYKSQLWRTETKEFTLYAVEGMTSRQVFERLLASYKPS
jgi:hypothetical protein